jgi:hypothetical protein
LQAESFNPRCLFLFGSYTIGKERLFLHVAQALRSKVYVAAAKRGIMACLDLPPEQAQLLTTNHLDANIHVVGTPRTAAADVGRTGVCSCAFGVGVLSAPAGNRATHMLPSRVVACCKHSSCCQAMWLM